MAQLPAQTALEAPAVRDEPRPGAAVRGWLFAVWALVLAMVVVGGITRLTGSGLSIVEWRPVTGILPPLSEHDWRELFAQYQASPQFREVNHWMALADFKRIFFWEYVHRLLGRLIGFAVALPFALFALQRKLPRALTWKLAGVLALGGLQGALGWYMVASGLVDEPRVSHYRLAAHLLLAFVTGSAVLWLALDLDFHVELREGAATPRMGGEGRVPFPIAKLAVVGLIALILLQCVYGAFMAGTHAGHYSTTFPDMNGRFAPGPFFTGPSLLRDALDSPLAIHYLHRAFAWGLLAYAFGLFAWLRRGGAPGVRRAAGWMALAVFVQLNLGALTVVNRVALPLAVFHQAVGFLVL
ncbi:MAG TPA: COX15/CtaA family protein, partial [Polyangiales bacterium]|nr:COX15/CtaA family protein [Polyangiales bacterium]